MLASRATGIALMIDHRAAQAGATKPEQTTPGADAVRESIGPELEARLLELYARLEDGTHYELLGVPQGADVKQIKAAYNELASMLHPDRYFRKNLGDLAPKLVRVFTRLTEACAMLAAPESRERYDRYLELRRSTAVSDDLLFDEAAHAAQLDAIRGLIAQHDEAGSAPPLAADAARPSRAPESDDAMRRRALARKLGYSSRPPARAPTSSVPPSGDPVWAAAELKRRYEQRVTNARRQQLERLEALADQAVEQNQLAQAVNALRVACSLAPEDVDLKRRHAELEQRAAAQHWEDYAERAEYELQDRRLAEAARSFERAALGHPSANLFERAAFCLLEAGGDLRRASQHAKRAVAMTPHSAKCRVTLARIYAAAGLRESALAELERARALQTRHEGIDELIRRIERGEA